jgi:ribosomal protein S18 acetylase RimI-like enzyme
MEAVINQAKDSGLRIVSCETQNTNVPAIRFYQRMGFQIEALDLSLYTNHDFPEGEIAIWMKRKIT